jgi:hypothetical protein
VDLVNKFSKILLAVLGGIEVTFNMFIPIILASLWVKVSLLDDWTVYFFYGLGLIATTWRAIKLGGWLK